MKKLSCLTLLTILVLTLAGCGGGGDDSPPRPVYRVDIFSSQPSDGDIAYDPVTQSTTVTNGPSILYFGIDALDPHFPEYRAFLDFPLDGSTGADVVPVDADIVSATLEVFIDEVSFAARVPSMIDLVIYSISRLRAADYDSPYLLTQKVNFYPADQGSIVAINITPLMRKAQRLGLADLQLRFILDLAVTNGFVGIEDRRTVALTAPLLKVDYAY
jgi:hypothetical protein